MFSHHACPLESCFFVVAVDERSRDVVGIRMTRVHQNVGCVDVSAKQIAGRKRRKIRKEKYYQLIEMKESWKITKWGCVLGYRQFWVLLEVPTSACSVVGMQGCNLATLRVICFSLRSVSVLRMLLAKTDVRRVPKEWSHTAATCKENASHASIIRIHFALFSYLLCFPHFCSLCWKMSNAYFCLARSQMWRTCGACGLVPDKDARKRHTSNLRAEWNVCWYHGDQHGSDHTPKIRIKLPTQVRSVICCKNISSTCCWNW